MTIEAIKRKVVVLRYAIDLLLFAETINGEGCWTNDRDRRVSNFITGATDCCLILDNFQKINGNQETASYRIEHIAYREKLDLTKPADRLVPQQKAFAEDPGLYERYRTANTVRIGKVL